MKLIEKGDVFKDAFGRRCTVTSIRRVRGFGTVVRGDVVNANPQDNRVYIYEGQINDFISKWRTK